VLDPSRAFILSQDQTLTLIPFLLRKKKERKKKEKKEIEYQLVTCFAKV